MNKSGRTFRRAASLLAVATALAMAGLLAGPAVAQDQDEEAPTVSQIEITSNAGPGDTYAAGDNIDFLVTFSEPVIVIGGLDLSLDVGGETRRALRNDPVISSAPITTMNFVYTVQDGDFDSDGVSIPADPLIKGFVTIQDEDGNDAILDHDAIADDPLHKVDGVPPAVSSIAITSDPGDDDTYGAGDRIYVTVTFSEDIIPSETLLLRLDIGGRAKLAAYNVLLSSSSDWLAQNPTSTMTLGYTVAVGDVDADGVSIQANTLSDERSLIRDVAGNAADLSHGPVPDDPGHMVNAPGGL